MATLQPPFDKVPPGSYKVQAKLVFWVSVGSLTVTESNDFVFAANGSYDAMGHSGTFDLRLELADRDPVSLSGPLSCAYNGTMTPGTYQKSGATIAFSTGAGTLSAWADAKGLYLEVPKFPQVYITPEL